jgi:hypothetical protein
MRDAGTVRRKSKQQDRAVVVVAQTSPRESWALACELVLIVAAREHLWPWLPAELQGMASKGLGAALVLVLLSVVYRHAPRSRVLVAVLGVAVWCSLQTLICSAAYMVEPWSVAPGQGICSARIEFDLGAVGVMLLAWLALWLSAPVKVDTTKHSK